MGRTEQAEQEAAGDEALVIRRRGEAAHRDAPGRDEERGEILGRDADDQVGREGLPAELRPVPDAADERVLVADEVRLLSHAQDGAVSDDGLGSSARQVSGRRRRTRSSRGTTRTLSRICRKYTHLRRRERSALTRARPGRRHRGRARDPHQERQDDLVDLAADGAGLKGREARRASVGRLPSRRLLRTTGIDATHLDVGHEQAVIVALAVRAGPG